MEDLSVLRIRWSGDLVAARKFVVDFVEDRRSSLSRARLAHTQLEASRAGRAKQDPRLDHVNCVEYHCFSSSHNCQLQFDIRKSGLLPCSIGRDGHAEMSANA